MILSISSKNRIPNINPIAAGKNANFPIPSDMSMDGISSDHTDAATITARMQNQAVLSVPDGQPFFIKKTHAAPNEVPRNGTSNPITKFNVSSYLFNLASALF